ncbi:MAG: aminodeoxychorismate synthase component I [Gammaproteobacteria bacterium]|nr:aminodeoxychorismate synthase component I [Gammaproteobacteria bacterium]
MTKPRAALPEDALPGLHARFPDRYPVLLESAGGDAPLGRFDVLLALPGEVLVQRADGGLEGHASSATGRFLDALDGWFLAERRALDPPRAVPFVGGWFLYLGYELAREIEPTVDFPTPRHPRAVAWRMRGAIVRDRLTGDATVVAEGHEAQRLSTQFERDLSRSPAADAASGPLLSGAVDEEDPARFIAGVEAVLEAIGRGDVYQANLSRGWSAMLAAGRKATDLYRRLSAANPAPFAGIAALPGFSVLSSSPERLLQVRDGVASTRPIAGTRPRGHTSAADDSLKQELVLNEKERAEHVMLVDLERNDLGRICRGGSVHVDEFMTVETYATVHHIVSNVRGLLRPGITPGQAIAAVFPGGTITGCPKVRCMQLLADLESGPRDAYTGSMGYLGLDGSLDLNILIRTLTVSGQRIDFRTGAGIVADSRPVAELEEPRAKAAGLLRALGGNT